MSASERDASNRGLARESKAKYGATSGDAEYAPIMGEDAGKNGSKCCGIEIRRKHVIIVVIAISICVLTIGLVLGLVDWKGVENNSPEVKPEQGIGAQTKPPPSISVLGNYTRAAVATDGEPCAQIGVDVLQRNGTAVDAAIATLFCDGLVNSHSMGIGGGFLMTIYLKEQDKVVTLNARETAPAAASPNMYGGNSSASARGAQSAGVPGEVRGYWEAKQLYGNKNVTWKSLVQPSIDMCFSGIPVTWHHASKLNSSKDTILKDPGMRKIFINPKTGDVWQEGDTYKRENLGYTLMEIAKNGVDEFYSGETAKNLVNDIQNAGGIITLDDLKNYRHMFNGSDSLLLGRHTIHSSPLPGSGAVLAYTLNILKHFDISPGDDTPLLYHRITEAFKWAYAERTKLGDPADPAITEEMNKLVSRMLGDQMAMTAFQKINDSYTVNNASFYGGDYFTPNDHGTAHTSVLAPNGDAVAVTSTVNLIFGSGFMSPSTGILLNDEMDDFSYPNITNFFGIMPSEANFAKPGKRPLSSMCPAIVLDANGEAVMVVGAAGGTQITTTVAQVILRNLWLEEDIKSSIDARRIHHQLLPMEVEVEKGVTEDVTDFLASRGHKLSPSPSIAVTQGISRKDGRIYANYDFRKSGGVAGF